MKNITLGLIGLILFCGCAQSAQKKAEAAVTEYIKKTANDPTSYESISFGGLDSLFSALGTDSAYNALDNQYFKDLQDRITYGSGKSDKELASEKKAIDVYEKNFVPKKFKGYSINHTFRAKNGFGALILNDYTFYLSPSLQVISSKDNGEAKD